jgi:hypothetical protein
MAIATILLTAGSVALSVALGQVALSSFVKVARMDTHRGQRQPARPDQSSSPVL